VAIASGLVPRLVHSDEGTHLAPLFVKGLVRSRVSSVRRSTPSSSKPRLTTAAV
jgi:hypothetical protein